MNVHVPGEGSIEAFWVVIGVMVVRARRDAGYFRRRGWL